MDFTYDAEQEALRDVARQAMGREVGGDLLRRMADDIDGIDEELWSTLVGLGWTGLLVPESQGGAGAGLAEMCIVLYETGRVPIARPVLLLVRFRHLGRPRSRRRPTPRRPGGRHPPRDGGSA